jgi:ribulose-phosphate 3-epimerase
MIKIAPSILSADFSCLKDEIRKVEKAGADMLHVDVMDGHFVPNITIGPAVVKDIRKVTKLPLDVHLMIENPGDYVDLFVKAGADMITFHIETISKTELRIKSQELRKSGVKVGISLNPATPLKRIIPVLGLVDFVLVMSVNPGFGGQEFIPSAVAKIKQLRAIFKGNIAVDGGINDINAKKVIQFGANILAAGSYIFKSNNCKEAIRRLRCQI